VAFIVLLAGVGVPMQDLLRRQGADILRVMGADEKSVARQRDLQTEIFKIVRERGDSAEAKEELRRVMQRFVSELTPEQLEAVGYSEAQLDGQIRMALTPWFRELLELDPRPTLEKVRCPVLAINGAKDIQVAAGENLAGIEQALRRGGNPDVTTVELPGLNHLFQTCTTGAVSEYSAIEETVNPKALETISDWIQLHSF
jgi:hypothetical protein